MDTSPKIKRESKNKIRVEFERAPLWERIKAKFFSMNFLKKVVFVVFRFVLLLGISYVILFPYISKIFQSFMSPSDFKDVTVVLISKNPTFDQYWYLITENNYFPLLLRTFALSLTTAIIQTFVCALVAYGLAKFKFKGNNLVFAVVVVTLMIPNEAISYSMHEYFNTWDYWAITEKFDAFLKGINENWKFSFMNSYIPMYLLSFTGLGFRNGLFIFMLRQFFRGVPDELEESAYVDGSSTMKTFFRIILPISIPMLITVFIFSFAWQWTDDFYAGMLFNSIYVFNHGYPNIREVVRMLPPSLQSGASGLPLYSAAVTGTGTILIALPLIVAYIFLQDKIVQGVERSGIVG